MKEILINLFLLNLFSIGNSNSMYSQNETDNIGMTIIK